MQALIDPTGHVCQIQTAAFAVTAAGYEWVDVGTSGAQVGWTYTSGAFAAPILSAAQTSAAAYSTLLAGGLTVTSTSTPALNGVYPIDAASQVTISTEAQFISTFSEFTNGGTVNLSWQLQTGAMVTFPTTAAFMSFAKAAAQVVAAAKLAAAQGAAMPSASVTIP
jgi:hypothetical protein